MPTKFLVATVLGAVGLLSAPLVAEAGGKLKRERGYAVRDCTPYNGPYGYYGNPYCDGGFKYAEDFPPGSRRYYNAFDLPQLQRHYRRGYWE